MKVILDKPKQSKPTCWNTLAHQFNKDQIDIFIGLDDYIEKYSQTFSYLTPEQQWEVYKIHPFTKAIMDAAIDQYMEFHHLL